MGGGRDERWRRGLGVLVLVALLAVTVWLLVRNRGGSTPPEAAGTGAAGAPNPSGGSASTGAPRSASVVAPALPGGGSAPAGAAGSATRSGGAAASSDLAPGSSRITTAFLRAQRTMLDRVDECYTLATAAGRDPRGHVSLTLRLTTEPEVVSIVELHGAKTTIADREVLDCLRENPTAIEEHVERLRAAGEKIDGTIEVKVERDLPPPPPADPDWPPDDASPPCPPGTTVAGDKPPAGTRQWCARPDGTQHGPGYIWDDRGRLVVIMSYTDGKTDNSVRMRDPDSE
jgi:hypothetical protein